MGLFTSEGSNADDMDIHEESGGEAGILRIEDLEVRDSIAKPEDGGNGGDEDRDNLAETGSLDSSAHSRRDDGDSSKKAEQVGDDVASGPGTPVMPKKDRKRKKKGKSNEEEKQGETVTDSESHDASSSSRSQPSPWNLRRFVESSYTQNVLYPGQFMDGTPPDDFEYLADDVTGKPQHSYVLDEAHPHAGTERRDLMVL
jgi:hypothetical protein